MCKFMFERAGSARFKSLRGSIVVWGLQSGKIRVHSCGNVPNKEGSVNASRSALSLQKVTRSLLCQHDKWKCIKFDLIHLQASGPWCTWNGCETFVIWEMVKILKRKKSESSLIKLWILLLGKWILPNANAVNNVYFVVFLVNNVLPFFLICVFKFSILIMIYVVGVHALTFCCEY